MQGSAGQKRVPTEFIKNLQIGYPALNEQYQITSFLDWKTAQINKFIHNKRRLIDLLKEQKQNVINQAVTRGLDPHVKLKPSGVEWLGDIPEHWEVRKFKHCARFYSGGTPSKAVESYWSGKLPWVSPKDMKTKFIDDAIDHISEEAVSSSAVGVIEAGHLLMVVRSGILRRSLPVGITCKRVAFNQDIKAIVVNPRYFCSEYLHALIEGCQRSLLEKWQKVGATVESIEHEFIANSYLPLPSIDEQGEILRWIEQESCLVDQAISRAQREIDLIREYRARLISDVVTGKVDVRGIKIPEVAKEELLALDDEAADTADMIEDETEMEVEE